MSEHVYDLIVIGAGPGGYVAAIRAAQLGMKVACVEKRGALGGTCLNVGCIPSKALLNTSHKFEDINHNGEKYGLKGSLKLDLKGMMKQKDDAVKGLTDGIAFLFKKNKVDWLKGEATILDGATVEVGGQPYATTNILIATGSESVPLAGLEIDETRVVTSTGALELPEVPKHLIVIGAGVIGLELGSVWQRLGAKVTVVEFLDRILPGMDGEVAKASQRIFEKQGMEFRLGTKVTGASVKGRNVTLNAEIMASGEKIALEGDVVLVAIGRRPYTAGLGLEQAGVKLDSRGRVEVDGNFRTSAPSILAIGDVIAGPMLAHKAEEEGIAAVEMLAGMKPHVNHDTIPGVVYTHPEIAVVGRTEEQLKEDKIPYTAGKFPMMANSRARTIGDSEGFVKILASRDEGRILGAHIVAPEAGTLIAELVLAMEYGASAEDVYRTCHAHPTLNEAVKEAALAVEGRPIHV